MANPWSQPASLMLLMLQAAAPIRVMILDGESGGSYHQWQVTTQVLKKELDETGLFQVEVVTAPPAGGGLAVKFVLGVCAGTRAERLDCRVS